MCLRSVTRELGKRIQGLNFVVHSLSEGSKLLGFGAE